MNRAESIIMAVSGGSEGEQKQKESPGKPAERDVSEFFRKHKKFFETYAGDSTLEIRPASEVGLDTFAIDLEKGILYAHPKFFEKHKYSEEKTLFASLHEYEHFRELRELLSEKNGGKVWDKHLAKIKTKRRFQIFDNCVGDIKMNRGVLARSAVLEETKEKLYREDQFPDTDYTKLPKHLQFAYAILRERMLSEKVAIDPVVRAELERLEKIKNSQSVSALDFLTAPETPMSMRLKLQERILEPVYEKFFKEDVEEEKRKKGEEKKGKGDGHSQSSEGRGEPQEGEIGEQTEGQSVSKTGAPEAKEAELKNPEDYFKEQYEKYFENRPEPVSLEDTDKTVREYEKAGKENKSAEEMAKEAYAKAEGVSQEELSRYQNFYKREVEAIVNPESGERAVDELRKLFERIISERARPRFVSKYPEREGDVLIKPAEAHVAVVSGEMEPEVWETVEKKEKPKELYGNFDVVLVCDRSGSMEGDKAQTQRRSAALILEALKEFSDELEERRKDLEYDLNVRTETWGFGGDSELGILKALSEGLSEKERVAVYNALGSTPGDNTKDFLALEAIEKNIPESDWKKIEKNKLLKVLIVLSDGESDNSSRVQKIEQSFRERGVVVVGVGMGNEARAIATTHAPDGIACEDISLLPKTLSDLLKKYLEELRKARK